MLSSHFRNRSAQAMVIIALSLPILIGMSALAVDVGLVWLNHRELQNVADSAALAAAQEYAGTTPASIDQARAQSAVAWILGASPSVTCGSPCVTFLNQETVKVDIEKNAQLAFASIFKIYTVKLSASAVAKASRQKTTGEAIIARGDLQLEFDSGPTGAMFNVTGDVVAYGTANGVSNGKIGLGAGTYSLYYGGISANVPLDSGSEKIHVDADEIIDNYESAIQAVYTGMPYNNYDPLQYCTSGIFFPVPQPASPSDPPFEVTEDVLATFGSLNVTVPKGAKARFVTKNGTMHMCRVVIQGEAYFDNGIYYIDDDFVGRPPGGTSPELLMTDTLPIAQGGKGGLTNTTGAIFSVIGNISLEGGDQVVAAHHELKGNPQFRDVLFLTKNKSSQISITTRKAGSLVGSIFAPESEVTIFGNPMGNTPSSRVTGSYMDNKGLVRRAQYGGRIIGKTVTLKILTQPGNINSWGADFVPPSSSNYVLLPTLIK